MPPQLLFQPQEKVLCWHGPLIYQAKVLKAEHWENEEGLNGPHYFVHYQGWKQTWDEWVPETRVLKLTEENIARQKTLADAQRAAEKPSQGKAVKEEGTPSGAGGEGRGRGKKEGRGTKRSRGDVEGEDEYIKRPEIRIAIPDPLKVQLVDDWEYVTKNGQLVSLPRTPNVQDVLAQYKEHYTREKKGGDAKSSKASSSALLTEFLSGLQLYFDKSLGANLLYRFERAQYVDARKKFAGEDAEMQPSKIYGAEHLLRLFVNLPGMLAHTTLDADAIMILKEHIAEFLKFLVKEQKRVFASEYESASPAYHRLSST